VTEGPFSEKLRTELGVARSLLDAVRASLKAPVFGSLSEMLLREKCRAERYKHRFAVVVMVSDCAYDLVGFRGLTNCLRASDLIGVMDGRTSSLPERLSEDLGSLDETVVKLGEQVLAVILPETDRAGAQVVAGRLKAEVADSHHFRIGTAVYPDDAAELEGLLAIAAGGANPIL
jgi:GGDEF domain-containing protein